MMTIVLVTCVLDWHSQIIIIVAMLPNFYMFHSEVLASFNFNKNKMLSPGLENNLTLKCCFGNFPTYSYMSRKIPEQHLNVWLFSNPGDKVQKDEELREQSVPYFQQESGTCPLDWRITIHSNVDLVFFQHS